MNNHLQMREVHLGKVTGDPEGGYQLEIPAIDTKTYLLAQLDDYMDLSRTKFPHQPPLRLKLEARTVGCDLQGTFGFGLWNDPFSFGLGPAGMSKLLPVLPNVAWFFYGSSQNHLTLRDDQPADGFHVKTFRSPLIPSVFSLFALPMLPFIFFHPTARWIRKLLRIFIKEESQAIAIDTGQWHVFSLEWWADHVIFKIDESWIFRSTTAPKGKLGLVIWVDNQFLRFDPKGKLSMGTLKTHSPQIMEFRNIEINSLRYD